MRKDTSRSDDRGNLEKLGESAGAVAGHAMDVGMQVGGALFRSASDVLGGWWSGEAPRQAADRWDDDAERRCRSHFDSTTASSDPAFKSATAAMRANPQSADAEVDIGDTHAEGSIGRTAFEQARPGYQFGYVASQNPAYRGRNFDDVEPELRSVWEREKETRPAGSWPEVRGFVDFGYQQDS